MKLSETFRLLFSTAAISLPLLSLPAFAGPGLSGGGKGVVCRDSSGAVQSVELLDLWEAREIHQLSVIPLTGDLKDNTRTVLERLSHAIPTDDIYELDNGKQVHGPTVIDYLLRSGVSPFFGSYPNVTIRWVNNMRLTPTEDSYEDATPADCGLEQIVRYDDFGSALSGSILVNKDLWDRMDLTNQVALLTHEAVYKVLRESGETSSLRTRRLVGQVLSGHPFTPVDTFSMPGAYYDCNFPRESQTQPGTPAGAASARIILQALPREAGKKTQTLRVLGEEVHAVFAFDTPALGEVKNVVSPEVPNAADLTSWARINRGHIFDVEFAQAFQPELRANIRIESARPGKLVVSVGAAPSVFVPDGMAWRQGVCTYHASNKQ